MFIRFVVLRKHAGSQYEEGVFQAAYGLRRRGLLSDYEEEWLKEILKRFSKNLARPVRLSRARRANAYKNAISWLKPTAREHITRIRDLVALLEHHGVLTKMIETDRPGYVVYEDAYQIAAVPFRDGDV